MSHPDAGANDPTPSPTPAARSSLSWIFVGRRRHAGWTTARAHGVASVPPSLSRRWRPRGCSCHRSLRGRYRRSLECRVATALPPSVGVTGLSLSHLRCTDGHRPILSRPLSCPPPPLRLPLAAAATVAVSAATATSSSFASICASTTPKCLPTLSPDATTPPPSAAPSPATTAPIPFLADGRREEKERDIRGEWEKEEGLER